MAINPLFRSSPVRMMGLASGMDTDFIIQQTLRVHQMRIDQRFRARTTLEWRQDTLNSVRDQITDLRNSFLRSSGATSLNMLNRNTFNTTVASATTASGANASAVTIRTNASSPMGSFTINSVQRLARGQQARSATPITGVNGNGFATTSQLHTMRFNANDRVSVDTVGEEWTVNVGGHDIQVARDSVTGAWSFSTNAVDGLGQPINIDDILTTAGFADDSNTGRITVNGETLDLTFSSGNLSAQSRLGWTNFTADIRVGTGTGAKDITLVRNTDGSFEVRGNNTDNMTATLDSQGRLQIMDGSELIDRFNVNDLGNSQFSLSRTADHRVALNTGLTGIGNVTLIRNEALDGTVTWSTSNDRVRVDTSTTGQIKLYRVDADGNPELDDDSNPIEVSYAWDGTATSNLTRLDALGNPVNADGSAVEAGEEIVLAGELRARNVGAGNLVGRADLEINGQTIRINANDSIAAMMNRVNATQGINARLSYDRLSDTFTLEGLVTNARPNPADATLSFSDNSGFFSKIGLDNNAILAGQQAVVEIDDGGPDGPRIMEFNSNNIDFRGVNITLNQVTGTWGENSGGIQVFTPNANSEITVNLTRDVTNALENIKSFIDAYNSLIQRIESLTRERKQPHEVSFGPLTDEEKAAMTERQIEQWEEIARRGILRNDNGLQNLARDLRNSLFQAVESVGMTPSQIGITTGSFFGGTGGQIVLDEDRLRAALEEDPDRVADIFSGTEENRGFLWRMNETLGTYVNRTQPNALRSLEASIRRTNEQMERMQMRMFAEEDRLFRQFAAMESAMSRLQNQGDWFNSMLGGMNQGRR